MTSSSPSIFPVPGGTGSSDVSSPIAPRHDDPGLRFDDLCPDESARQCQGRSEKPKTDRVNCHEGIEDGAVDGDSPVEDDVAVEAKPEAEPLAEDEVVELETETEPVSEDDAVAAVEEGDSLVITLSRADLRNPAKLLAAIASAIASQSGNATPQELQLVLQPANGSQAADAATKTISVPLSAEVVQLPGKGQGPGQGHAVAATLSAVMQAALAYAKEPAGAKTPITSQPATGTPGATAPAEPAKMVAISTAPAGLAEGEKTSAPKVNPTGLEVGGRGENFLPSHNQRETTDLVRAGTDGALQGENMRTAPRQIQNRAAANLAELRGGTASGAEAAVAETMSDASKGWTNGNGEQGFTNARFAHLSERIVGMMATQPTPAVPAPAATTPVALPAPVVPAFPVSEAALLGPLGNAVERMILRGQDQLSLTIRFEQGGSLALRLALQNGEIKTQIRTDVAGLENALRAAWTTFSQDWNNRGVKLAAPVFSTSPDQHHSTAHQDAHPDFEGGDGSPRFHGHNRFGAAVRNPRARAATPVTSDQPSRTHQRGLHVWA